MANAEKGAMMFYGGKIKSIKAGDRVLEIGPGASPYHRSDAFLEIRLETLEEQIMQRGEVVAEPNYGGRPVYFYDGKEFPFSEGEFDYVICSHVIEHVEDPELFMLEVFRVGRGRGYIEYPLIAYEYMYDFDVHKQILKYIDQADELIFVKKSQLGLSQFSPVTTILRRSLERKWDDVVAANKQMFFEGFEFERPFKVSNDLDLSKYINSRYEFPEKSILRRLVNKLLGILRL